MKPAMPNLQLSALTESLNSVTSQLAADAVRTSSTPVAQRMLNSRQLFGVANEVLIEHAGFTYRLRITQANKLILTK